MFCFLLFELIASIKKHNKYSKEENKPITFRVQLDFRSVLLNI